MRSDLIDDCGDLALLGLRVFLRSDVQVSIRIEVKLEKVAGTAKRIK